MTSLDLYLIRCQRNALWAALPLFVLVGFEVVVTWKLPTSQDGFDQCFMLLPLATALVALTYLLAANANDLLQRSIAVGCALTGMTGFMLVAVFKFGLAPGWSVVLYGMVPTVWSLLAAILIPMRPSVDGGLAWWRVLIVLALAGAVPAYFVLQTRGMAAQAVFVLLLVGAPVAFVVACARYASPLRSIIAAECIGGIVGAFVDHRGGPEAITWAAPLALLYAFAAGMAHVASRARSMTAVRQLDGEPVRIPRRLGKSRSFVPNTIAVGCVLVVAGWAFVSRSRGDFRTVPIVRNGPVDELGSNIDPLKGMMQTGRPSAGTSGDISLSAPNANAGIEAVNAAFKKLGWTPLGTVRDTDGDGADEYLDAWGNAMVYFDATDYAAASTGVLYVRGDGTKFTVKPHIDPATGVFFRLLSFQLFSIGRDGLPNTDDDLEYGR